MESHMEIYVSNLDTINNILSDVSFLYTKYFILHTDYHK